jgi:hypothetical protein
VLSGKFQPLLPHLLPSILEHGWSPHPYARVSGPHSCKSWHSVFIQYLMCQGHSSAGLIDKIEQTITEWPLYAGHIAKNCSGLKIKSHLLTR